MADAILGEDHLASNKQSPTIPKLTLPEHWHALPGVVDDPLLDEDAQVGILKRVDETGSASLEDLMAVLPDHPKPAKAVLLLVRLGILQIEPGLTDANSMLTRRLERPMVFDPGSTGGNGESGDTGSALQVAEKGKLRRLKIVRPQPEIFFAHWTDRAVFRREPALERRGIYLALYCSTAYGGRSSRLVDRLIDSNHLLQHGIPDLLIAVVDRNNTLTESQIKVAERLLVRAIDEDGKLKPANKVMPDGDRLDFASFVLVDRFVRDVVRSLREAGIAFTGGKTGVDGAQTPLDAGDASGIDEVLPENGASDPLHFSLHACGVHATAQAIDGKWTVLTGSQVRTQVLQSAGSGVAQRRQEALHDGSLVPNRGHLLLTRDLVFETASAAARFVVGTGHKGRIWRPLPKQAPMGGLYH
jgi:hypothetical protein